MQENLSPNSTEAAELLKQRKVWWSDFRSEYVRRLLVSVIAFSMAIPFFLWLSGRTISESWLILSAFAIAMPVLAVAKTLWKLPDWPRAGRR